MEEAILVLINGPPCALISSIATQNEQHHLSFEHVNEIFIFISVPVYSLFYSKRATDDSSAE